MSAKSNQNGFSHVEGLLILIIVLIVGFIGYYVYTTKQNTDKSLTVSTTKTAPKTNKTAAKPSAQNVVKIPELGIQLVNVPESIKDMTYEVSQPSADQDFKSVYFTTPSLVKLDARCSLGGLANYTGIYKSAADQEPLTTFVKQFDNFWIASLRNGVPCGEVGSASFNLQAEQTAALSKLVKTDSNIQLNK